MHKKRIIIAAVGEKGVNYGNDHNMPKEFLELVSTSRQILGLLLAAVLLRIFGFSTGWRIASAFFFSRRVFARVHAEAWCRSRPGVFGWPV